MAKVSNRYCSPTNGLKASDFFIGYRYGKVEDPKLRRKYKTYNNLAGEIFADCLGEILLDIIENNVIFVLSLDANCYAEICCETMSTHTFKTLYQSGFLQKIDYIKSEFTANQLLFKYKLPKYKMRESRLRVYGKINDALIDSANKGKKY